MCPVCLSETARLIGPHPDFSGCDIRRCNRCRLVRVHPWPTVEELAERYREEYRQRINELPSPDYLDFMDRRAASQIRFVSSCIDVSGSFGRVLDIGCSAGSLLKALADHAAELTGYEPDHIMADTARRRLPNRVSIHNELCDPERLPDNAFDLITMSHVLEHVIDPVSFLSQLSRVTGSGGRVFVEVPHEPLSEVRRIIAAGFRGKMHLTHFTPKTLKRCVEAAGGSVVALRTFGPSCDQFSIVPLHAMSCGWTGRVSNRIRNVCHRLGLARSQVGPIDLGAWLDVENSSRGIFIRAIIALEPTSQPMRPASHPKRSSAA